MDIVGRDLERWELVKKRLKTRHLGLRRAATVVILLGFEVVLVVFQTSGSRNVFNSRSEPLVSMGSSVCLILRFTCFLLVGKINDDAIQFK